MISVFQAAVTSTPGAIAVVPPGQCTITLSNAGATTIYVGGTSVSTANGFPVTGGSFPVSIPGYGGGRPETLYAVIAASAPLLAASSSVPGIFDPGAAVPASPGASSGGGGSAILGITIQQ